MVLQVKRQGKKIDFLWNASGQLSIQKTLRRFMRMVKYLSKFDHSLRTKRKPLNRLTQKDQVFKWVKVQQRTFVDIKKAIANTPVLTNYNLEKPVTIQTDMSDVGVGAVLL